MEGGGVSELVSHAHSDVEAGFELRRPGFDSQRLSICAVGSDGGCKLGGSLTIHQYAC